eukprot:COSAG02_NODE_7125_length_3170_cov_2.337024_4_plen_119_part_00
MYWYRIISSCTRHFIPPGLTTCIPRVHTVVARRCARAAIKSRKFLLSERLAARRAKMRPALQLLTTLACTSVQVCSAAPKRNVMYATRRSHACHVSLMWWWDTGATDRHDGRATSGTS